MLVELRIRLLHQLSVPLVLLLLLLHVLRAHTRPQQAEPHLMLLERPASLALLVTLVLVVLSTRLPAREPALFKLVHLAKLFALHTRHVLPAAILQPLLLLLYPQQRELAVYLALLVSYWMNLQ